MRHTTSAPVSKVRVAESRGPRDRLGVWRPTVQLFWLVWVHGVSGVDAAVGVDPLPDEEG